MVALQLQPCSGLRVVLPVAQVAVKVIFFDKNMREHNIQLALLEFCCPNYS